MTAGEDVVVITGISGFVGPHVARAFRDAGFRVIGWGRDAAIPESLDALIDDYQTVDLTRELPAIAPCRAIVHLAGLAAVGASFARPQSYLADNSAMITNLCEGLLDSDLRPRIVGVSSGTVYAASLEPLDEDAAVGFSSPYAVSKVLGENQLAYYVQRGLECVVARPFNHAGPGQGPGFLVPDLISGMRTALATGGELTVGDLSTVRDYTDVRDVARAYVALATAGTLAHSRYNVCSGIGTAGTEILELVRSAVGGDSVRIASGELRPSDLPRVVGDGTRLRSELGWAPRIPLAQTIADAAHAA